MPGCWGRGPTLKEAAQQCEKAGAKPKDYVIADLVIGDDKPSITHHGMVIEHHHNARIVRVGTSFKLGALLKLDTES